MSAGKSILSSMKPAAKVAYGGSYMEELNWWEKKYESSLFNELKYMVPEILFIRGLWKENRSLWWVSFPFHFGLYLMIATFGLLLLHACFILWRFPAFAAGSAIRSLLDGLIVFAGWTGLILGNIGSSGSSLQTADRSGTEKLFVFFRLFQYPVHLSFFSFRLRRLSAR